MIDFSDALPPTLVRGLPGCRGRVGMMPAMCTRCKSMVTSTGGGSLWCLLLGRVGACVRRAAYTAGRRLWRRFCDGRRCRRRSRAW